MRAAALFCSYTIPLFSSFLYFLSFANSLQFNIYRFYPRDPNIIYHGDAVPFGGAILFNDVHYTCRVGWAIYAEKVALWDSQTNRITDFTTHFSFTIDTLGRAYRGYGHGLAFFLGPEGFEIPPNSASGFLGLFNTTTSHSSRNQIVLVEFDTYHNIEFDPSDQPTAHVGINSNSISSNVSVPWNPTLHTGDTAHVWITYNSSTMNLNVSWKYESTSNPQENTTLSYKIDLRKVLPEWVTIGFSAATGAIIERHVLKSWEFYSTLDISRGKTKRRLTIILIIISGVALISGAITAYAILWRWENRKSRTSMTRELTSAKEDDPKPAEGPTRTFPYAEIALATDNFSSERKVGEGVFGAVYKGDFVNPDKPLAVKKISRGSTQEKIKCISQVKIISQLKHQNLVQLIGFCEDRGEFLLVYEFMPNDSLDSYLFGKNSPLAWAVRYKISLDLASAVFYLHEQQEQSVLHQNIKSNNVFLDSSFNAKLGDFGFSELLFHELDPQATAYAATLGSLAPEYARTGKASKESDIYSFGIVALEIATGRRAICLTKNEDCEKGLVEWVWDHYGRGELGVLALDERVRMDYDEKQVERLMIVGLWCAHPDMKLRPSIGQAIQALKFEATIPELPPKMPDPKSIFYLEAAMNPP